MQQEKEGSSHLVSSLNVKQYWQVQGDFPRIKEKHVEISIHAYTKGNVPEDTFKWMYIFYTYPIFLFFIIIVCILFIFTESVKKNVLDKCTIFEDVYVYVKSTFSKQSNHPYSFPHFSIL